MLPDKLFARSITPRLWRQTISSTARDDSTQSIKKYSKEKGTPPLRTAPSDWTPDDEIILYKGKSYIPPDIDLRQDIIREFHTPPSSGHPGLFKTLEHYWWPRMSTMVKQFIDGCTACQQMKPNTHPTAAPLMPIKSHAHRPFQQITTELITNSPPKQRLELIFFLSWSIKDLQRE